MEHKGTKNLETERLLLRKFKISDAEAMFNNWASDSQVTKFLTWPAHKNPRASKKILRNWKFGYFKKNTYNWAIVLKDINQPIGSIGVVKIHEITNACEIGYCIGKEYWRKGITAEALKKVIEYLFNEIGFNRIEAKHDTRNPNSGKVMQKAGMQLEGTLRQVGIVTETGLSDCKVYSILKSEYQMINQ